MTPFTRRCSPQEQFYGLPKVDKRDIPLRPGARVLGPLVGKALILRIPRFGYPKSMVYSSNKNKVSLPVMSLHLSHLYQQTLPSTS